MLSSLQNPLIKQIRKLQQAKHRRQQGQFLLEGTHLLQAACAARWPLKVICYTADWRAKSSEVWQRIDLAQTRCELVSAAVLQSISTTVHPDGVVAVARSQPSPLAPPTITHLGLVLETIQDPGNLGTIIRTAVATEAEALLLNAPNVDPENPKVLRASAGAWFHRPLHITTDLRQTVQHYQQQGLQVIATAPTAPRPYWQVDYRCPTLIMIGNEGAGLTLSLLELADHRVSIPLGGGVESLNVAIATALLLYEVRRQRSRP